MYKDLSLKEKAKVIREGVRLGLNSIDDILSLYDDAIGHKFLGDTLSKINKFKTPEEILAERYGVEPIVSDNTAVILESVFTPQEKSYAAALQAFYERHKSPEAEEKALRKARQAVKDLKAAEFGTLDTPQSTNLLYTWRRFNNSKGSELLYPIPGIGEAMFGVDVADLLYSGDYGNAIGDLALYGTMAYAPEIASKIGKIVRETKTAYKFNTNPINKTNNVTMSYPWQKQAVSKTLFTNNIPYRLNEGKPILQLQEPVSNNTYVINNEKPVLLLQQPVDNPFVNTAGEVDEKAFTLYVKELFAKNNGAMTYHPSPLVRGYNADVIKHSLDAAKSALTLPLPQGVDRLSFVTTVLLHDIGESLGRELHGLKGKILLENEPFIKGNPLGNQMLEAISNHMTTKHLDTYNILLGLRAADAARGVNYQEARLRWPSFFDYKPLNLLYDASKKTIESNRIFLLNFNDYFSKYGREPILIDNLSDTEAVNNAAKEVIEKHNSFLRGVRDFKFNKNLTDKQKQASYDRMKLLGMDPESREDRINFSLMYYVPETGSGRVGFHPDKNYSGVIYTSNDLGTAAGYATSNNGHTHNGEVALLRRPYKLGADRNLWMQEGDFVLRDRQEGPYYDLNKAIEDNDIGDSKLLLTLKQQGYQSFMDDPEKKQLLDFIHEGEQRKYELDKMRKDAMIAFAPDNIKNAVYLEADAKLLEKATDYLLDIINPALLLVGLNTWDIPNTFTHKLAVYLENLSDAIQQRARTNEGLSKGKMFYDIKRSKVTPKQMKDFGFIQHGKLENKIFSKTTPLIKNNREFYIYPLKTIDFYNQELLDLRDLHNSIALEGYIPLGLDAFYLQPKNDELRIYTTEGLKQPSLDESGLYLHYLFPGKAGEKGLDLVRWLDRSEWVKLGRDASRGHHGKMHYPDASTKTFSKGGPIVSPYGQWKYPGKDTIIPSNNITMNNVNYPVLGVSDTGDAKIMMPWNNYKFRGSMVYEHPLIGNQFQLGGLAKPFSYEDIPDVRYLKGGETQKYLNVPDYNVALYNTVSPLGDFPNFWEALAYRRLVKDKLKNGNIYERDYPVGNTQGEKTAMAAWAKRLGIPYDELDLPVYNGDTVTLPNSLVLEIPYDTNVLKNRIQLNKALLDKYSKYRYSDVVDAAIKADLYNLDKLRETYKTGKSVGLTEFGWNSRLLVNNGEIVPIENIQSPLNVLGNYNVRYSPEERRLYYSDEYDFNQFENFVPGEPFRIRGYIDLNNKALGGNLFKKGNAHIKQLAGPIKQRLDFKANIGTKILSLPRLIMKGFDDPVAHEDLGRYYFGLPLKDNYLEYSKYKPQKSKNKNSTYIAINDPYFLEELINGYYSNTGWVDKLNGIKSGYEMPSNIELIIRVREGKQKVTPYDLGRFTLTSGIDPNKGQYISYYDIWDASGNVNRPNLNKPEWYRLWGTKPFEVYDRIYLDDYYGVDSTPQLNTYYGGWIAPVTVTPNEYKKGGSIHIKPENRGKFTALKKRTGHSASWFKAHGTPALKKMATFALNAKKWNHKHDEGGYLYSEGGFLLAPYLYNE